HHEELAGTLGTVAHEDAGRVGDLPVAAEAEPGLPDHGLASEEDGPRGAGDDRACELTAQELVMLHEPLGDANHYLGLGEGGGGHDASPLARGCCLPVRRV